MYFLVQNIKANQKKKVQLLQYSNTVHAVVFEYIQYFDLNMYCIRIFVCTVV